MPSYPIMTCFLLGGTLSSGQMAQAAEGAPQTLRDLGARANVVVGTAVDVDALAKDPAYAEIVASQFASLTPENAMKWAPIEHTKGQRDLHAATFVAQFARDHKQTLRGHALVWDLEIPSWVDTSAPAVLSREQFRHLTETVQAFQGQVATWDVVNEALDANGNRADNVLARALGPTYIEDAFRAARKADPKAILAYNDHGVLWPGPKADGLTRLVGGLKGGGVPIDAVGLQSHLHLVPDWRIDWAGVRAHLQHLASLGVAVHLTEVDVRTADLAGGSLGRQLAQAQAFYAMSRICRDLPACTHLTFWGFTDRYSWVDRTLGPDDPLLWDDQLQPKQGLFAVQDGLSGKPWSGCSTNWAANGDLEGGVGAFVTPGGRLVRSREAAAKGEYGLRSTDRTETWQGPRLDVSQLLAEGVDWRIQADARTTSGQILRMTLRVEDARGETYESLLAVSGNGAWQHLDTTFRPDFSGPVRRIDWYIEGPEAGHNIDIDNVSIGIVCPTF